MGKRGVGRVAIFLLLIILFTLSVSATSQSFFSSNFFSYGDFSAKTVFSSSIDIPDSVNNVIQKKPSSDQNTNTNTESNSLSSQTQDSDGQKDFNSEAVWITRNACGVQGLDTTIFNSGENVYINGENIEQGSYGWQIKGQFGESCDSGQIVASGTVSVGYLKKFCFKAYTISENDGGQYNFLKAGIKLDEYNVNQLCTTCGNGILEVGEQCDDGNINNTDSCNNQCQVNVCVHDTCQELGKVCGSWSDSCGGILNCGLTTTSCTSEFGTCDVNGTKSCNVNGTGYGSCNAVDPRPSNCQGLECGSDQCGGTCGICGNNETCEQNICVPNPYCGDGTIDAWEECDDGTDNGNACTPEYNDFCVYCTDSCDYEKLKGPECGDGELNTPQEQCDDGNLVNSDGCDNQCNIESQCFYSCFSPNSLNDTTLEIIKMNVEKNLQTLLNESGYNVDVKSDQANVQIWETDRNVELEITYLGRIASYPHAFGYYLDGNISTFVPVFENNGNHPWFNVTYFVPGNKTTISVPSGHEVGFAMHTYAAGHPYGNPSIFYYTENSLNPLGKDQAIVFDVCDEFIVAFDDTFGDRDYQDLVVSVKRLSCSEEPVCGNGITESPEQCDDGNIVNDDQCNNQCDINPYCGDGLLNQDLEECDDGNMQSGDGCDAECFIEEEICEHDVGVRHSYGNGVGTGIGIKYTQNSTFIMSNPAQLLQGQNYELKFFIENNIPNSTNNIHVIIKINDTIIANYNRFINRTHNGNVDLNASQFSAGSYLINLDVEKINETDCNLSDNHAERWIIIEEGEELPYCGDGIVNGNEQCDDGNLINNDGCSSLCEFEIVCDENSDCGTDFYSGQFCSGEDVAKNFTRFICNYPETPQSYCSNSTSTNITQQCNYGCSNGQCDLCIPKTCESLNKVCGQWSDSCGGILNCGLTTTSCTSEFGTCDVNGTKSCNVNGTGYGSCNAVDPRPSNCQGLECGSDQCGGTCGICGNNETCEQNICVPNPYCGDGTIDAWEECDDGTDNGNACVPRYDEICSYCSNACDDIIITGTYCGDSQLNTPQEECDDGNTNNNDRCNNQCQKNGIGVEDFPPLVWMCDDRVVYDDATEPGRITDDGDKLWERMNNYAFEGEQVQWEVLVMDKNKIDQNIDVYATIGDVQGEGNDIEVNCVRDGYNEEIFRSCNARILEEQVRWDSDLMDFFTCTLTVETPESMYGEYWITVEALDGDGLMGTFDENEYWFLNPEIALGIDGELVFENVRPETSSYSDTILVSNEADDGSGVRLDMFISGTDFYDSSSSGARCPVSNQLELENFAYFATHGAYSSQSDPRSDVEGYLPIGYGIGFNDPNPFYGSFVGDTAGYEILQTFPMNFAYFQSNILSPGAEFAITFRLDLPEPCNGDFDTGSIFFWGEAI